MVFQPHPRQKNKEAKPKKGVKEISTFPGKYVQKLEQEGKDEISRPKPPPKNNAS